MENIKTRIDRPDHRHLKKPPLSGPHFQKQYGADLHVSHETFERLTIYLDLLSRWNRQHNLVGAATMQDPWRRHILDAAQLVPFLNHNAPDDAGRSLTMVDLGSGAGLPGLVVAIISHLCVHLIESNHKKCAFLTQAAAATNTQVTIHCRRIEEMEPMAADIITARALAPLSDLLRYADHLGGRLGPKRLIALKGKNWRHEVATASKTWHFQMCTQSSISDSSARLLDITDYYPLKASLETGSKIK